MSDFKTWWNKEGSAMRPLQNEDMEEFAKRVTEIAWRNGGFCEKRKAKPVTDVVMQAFMGLPKRKLDTLLKADWRINGVSIEHEEAGVIKRGAVTFGGMVLWWNAEQLVNKGGTK